MAERLATGVVRQIGFDAQLTKIVDPRGLDELLRTSITAAAAEALTAAKASSDAPPVSEVGSRMPR
jgi:hypothetical protein